MGKFFHSVRETKVALGAESMRHGCCTAEHSRDSFTVEVLQKYQCVSLHVYFPVNCAKVNNQGNLLQDHL